MPRTISARDAKKLIGTKEVRSELEKIAACVPIRVRHNSTYEKSDFLAELLWMALTQSTAEASCESVSPDALLRQLSFSVEQLLVMRDNMLGVTIESARQLGAFRVPIDIAIDGNPLPYYGKKRKAWVTGGKYKAGTNWFVNWMCIDSVIAGERLTLALEPRSQWSRLSDIVARLLDDVIARRIAIRRILLDREFPGVDVLETLMVRGLHFIAAVKDDARIKRAKQSLMKSRNTASAMPWKIRKGKREINVTLMLIKVKKGKKTKIYSWLANFDGDPHAIVEEYRSRWGIETNNRDRKHFRPWTTSNRFELRMLYYLLSTVLLNLWFVLNLLIAAQLRIVLVKPLLRKYTMKKIYMAELCGAAC